MAINNKGLTLLEILVAVMLLAVVIGGLASIITSSKWYIMHTRSWMVVGELARYFLDPLQGNVSQDTWNTSCLGKQNCTMQTLQDTQLSPGNYNYTYNATYGISNVTSGAETIGNLTKVVLTISWSNETAPE